MKISEQTTDLELAVIISQAPEVSGITATLVGGAAVSVHTHNEYKSVDLDFVTDARRENLLAVLKPLGFDLARDKRHFHHPRSSYLIQFPTSPLEFGNRRVRHDEIPKLQTNWGPLRVITPTLCVMDRLAAFWHWNDRQSWDQAVMLARHAELDFADLLSFAAGEGMAAQDIVKLQKIAREIND